jgi:hypothetical protein
MPSRKFIGSIYFKRTINGNLIGEFSNNEDPVIRTESAVSQGYYSDYTGKCISTWFDGSMRQAILEINPVLNSGKLKLEWTDDARIIYIGEGFLMNDTLIGYYHKG